MDRFILRRTSAGYSLFGVREMGRKQVLGTIDSKGKFDLNDKATAGAEMDAAYQRRKDLEAGAESDPQIKAALDLANQIGALSEAIETGVQALDPATSDLLIKAAYDLRSAVVSGAIDQQHKASTAEEESPEYHLDHALHLIRQNKNAEAFEALKTAEAGGYSNRAYLSEIRAGLCLSLNDLEGAFDALSLACAGAASPARPARALLPRFLKKGHGEKFKDWLSSFSDGVQQSWVYTLLARIADHEGNSEEAIAHNGLALKLDPTNLTAARALIDAAFRNGDMDLARSVFQKAASNVTGAAHMQNALARLRMDEKDFAAAMEASENAVTLEPENSNFWFIRGVSLRRGAALKEALVAFQTAVRLNPSAAFSHYNLSLCAQQLNESELALSAAQTAVNLAPQNKTFQAQLVALGGVPAPSTRAATAVQPETKKAKPKTSAKKPTAPKAKAKANANWPRLG